MEYVLGWEKEVKGVSDQPSHNLARCPSRIWWSECSGLFRSPLSVPFGLPEGTAKDPHFATTPCSRI